MSKKAKKDITDVLLTAPKKDRGVNAPHIPQIYEKNFMHQADLLFLPHDGKNKYALVVVDVGSREVDAEPLTSKQPGEITKAFEKIYKRDILDYPTILQIDAGNEFKGAATTWFKKQKIITRTAKVGRHRQQALVEAKNKMIAQRLFKRMLQQEILTGYPSNQWVVDLPEAIKDINQKVIKTAKKKKKDKYADVFRCMGDACNVYEQGMKVRVALDVPRDYLSNKRLHGKFRATDIRFSITPHTITSTLIRPGSPVLYFIDNDMTTGYTKSQLIPFNDEKVEANASQVIRPVNKKNGHDVFVIDKIINKRKYRNRIEYLVTWKGYPDSEATWEKRTVLIEDAPDLVEEYENS